MNQLKLVENTPNEKEIAKRPIIPLPQLNKISPNSSLQIPSIAKGTQSQMVIIQNDEVKQTMPIFDLTKTREPFVICKIPLEIYTRVVKLIQENSSSKKSNLIKGSWSEEEDRILIDLVQKYGPKRWTFLASQGIGQRTGKQCRERYLNHLDSSIKKTEWTEAEDQSIVRMQKQIGNKWAKISKILNGRTPNMIKNRWNSTLKKKYAMNSATKIV